MSTKIVMIDLEQPLPAEIPHADNYDTVWAIVLRHQIPVGQVEIGNKRTPVLALQLRSEIIRQLGDVLLGGQNAQSAHLTISTNCQPKLTATQWFEKPDLEAFLQGLEPQPGRTFFISVVVCTRDRPEDLRMCLETLVQLEAGRHRVELIVVDNNPASGRTKAVADDFPQVRYEMETRPGVAYGRNKGFASAQGDIVAYIDDDVRVPPHWPSRILAPFADPRVMCVSGLVLPLEMESESQEMFEKYGALGRGYAPRIFDRQFFNHSTKHVVCTWDLGSTANVAIRKAVLADSGMFDETLGPGQPTGVGEDIYTFYRILKAGHVCYYEPAAYVWHKHRTSMAALRKQLYQYSKGHTSYQLRTLFTDGDRRAVRQLLWDLPRWHVARIWRIFRGQEVYLPRLVALEIWGNLVGFWAFWQAVRQHRRLNGPGANPIQPARGPKELLSQIFSPSQM